MVNKMQTLTAQDNPSLKLYRKLATSKKARRETGCFVLEGKRLVRDALQSGAALTHLFLTEAAWRREPELWVGLPPDIHMALVTEPLAASLAQTEHSQGIFAICRIPQPPSLASFFQSGGTYAVLYQLQDPGNAGMILRTADALGLDGVVFCNSCDIYSPKVVRATMGSLFRVPLCCTSDPTTVLESCRKHQIETCAAVVDKDAVHVGACQFQDGTAIWIGNEGNGLSPEIAAACDRRITIPMHGTVESLNAAMAAGIILWEVKRGKG